MARFGQLRWVPMLIRAYYDAQNRVESGVMVDGLKSDASPEPKPEPMNMRPPAIVARNARRAPSLSRKHNHVNTVRRKSTGGASDKNTRLLRELRAANRKLESLDSIERRLQQLGAVLDGFNQQITQLKSESTLEQLGAKEVTRSATAKTHLTQPDHLTGPPEEPPYTF